MTENEKLASAEDYYNRGSEFFVEGDFDQAIVAFNKAIELNVNHLLAYIFRGKVYLAKSEFEQAVVDCTKAIQLNPNISEVYKNRGRAYLMLLGKGDQAIADLTQAITLSPNDSEAYHFRGAVYAAHKKEFDKAITDFETALQLDPNNVNAKKGLEAAEEQKREAERQKRIEEQEKAKKGRKKAIGLGALLVVLLTWAMPAWTGIHWDWGLGFGMTAYAVIAAIFGPVAGILIGIISTILRWVFQFPLLFFPALLSFALFGFGVGAFWKFYRLETGKFGVKEALIFNGVQIVANFIRLFIFRLLISVQFDVPFIIPRPVLISFVSSSAIVLVLGTALLFAYSKYRQKKLAF